MTIEVCTTGEDVEIIRVLSLTSSPFHQTSKDNYSALIFFLTYFSYFTEIFLKSQKVLPYQYFLSWKEVLEFIKIKFLYF